MLKSERIQMILDIVNQKKTVSTQELAEKLNISEISVRRYTLELEQENKLRRVHGGAESLVNGTSSFEFNHSKKLLVNREEKLEIAQRAAELVQNGDTLYLSPGTTVQTFAGLLVNKKITVITNSITVFDTLKNSTKIELLLVGGKYRKTTGCFYGSIPNRILANFQPDMAFFSVNAVKDLRALNHNIEEGETQRVALDSASKRFLLADSSKFERNDIYSFYDLNQIDALIVDQGLPKEKFKYYQQYFQVMMTK